MRKFTSLFLLFVLLVSTTACAPLKSLGVWRCTVMNQGNFFIQYKYDENGKLAEIMEYQNVEPMMDEGDFQTTIETTRITVDEKGSISAVTDSRGSTIEIKGDKIWELSRGALTLTVSYNEGFQTEQQVLELADNVKVTTTNEFDSSGKMTSSISETEFFDGSPKRITITEYDYEYDHYGNPIIQYAIQDGSKTISATYSWEWYSRFLQWKI